MKERSVTFNHGYLCEMLQAASDNELANVINDVQKIQEQRKNFRKQTALIKIQSAISEAIRQGYIVEFTEECEECPSEAINFYLHANNSPHITITLKED